ncbi:hypothetical protein JW897_02255 [Chromobacterium alkanivorans]|uniref:hypothetical protein n=1 Tax=Chromobacterium alkanivorans TaxID=1071719 RepID=UPI00196825FD|nr:hypothetical protein [Chromobacterium alkanivorans]MBN3002552.1 hypothetical protein [Chromobacterium alkanivorans]
MEPNFSIISSLLKISFAPFRWAWAKVSQPSIPYSTAPKNILHCMLPRTPKRQIEQRFGVPSNEDAYPDGRTIVGYVFSNALIQIEYDNQNTVDSVLLVNLHRAAYLKWPLNRFRGFQIPYLSFIVGRSTLGDVFGPEKLILSKDYSSKFFILWRKEYYGNPGRYNTYQFGLFSADTYPGSDFEIPDCESLEGGTQGLACIANPNKHLFNAVRITKEDFDSVEYFGYSHGIFP